MTKTTLIKTIFNWDWLTGSIIIKVGTWQLPGRFVSEDLSILHLVPKANRRILASKEVLNTTPLMTPFLHPGHTYSNKATPIPIRPHLLIVPFPTTIIFKPSHTPTQNTYRYTHSHKLTQMQIETYI